uniref:Small ribosomal subunit protein uS11m n=1 Tax=Canis lupus familiaris TaxID=9615 RepID=A0A8C0PMD3_CANLF
MQVVRTTRSWLLRWWAWSPTPRVVAGAPASTVHAGARQLQNQAAKQEAGEKAEASTPSRSGFSATTPACIHSRFGARRCARCWECKYRRWFYPTSSSQATGEDSHANICSIICIYPPVPGQESPLRWAGKKFEEIPIAHIKASYNNTQIQVVSAANQPLARTSCGTEGFRNAKKGTGIAAQTAGIAAAVKATGKGVTHIRVVVKGLGPGRLSAIKGLTMGGLEVISITDNTPIPHNGCRPRKARRL